MSQSKLFEVERKEAGATLCPKCHQTVTFVAETHEWAFDETTGQYKHRAYGPPEVTHCNQRLIAGPDGLEVYPVEVKRG
jgi:nitrite reductase/ring-hydroxylating ferredoxin subunit